MLLYFIYSVILSVLIQNTLYGVKGDNENLEEFFMEVEV